MSKDIKKPAGETRRYVGIDLGDKKSRVCTLDERGEIVLQEWVVTAPEAFFKRFRGETKMDIAMEVGTHSRLTIFKIIMSASANPINAYQISYPFPCFSRGKNTCMSNNIVSFKSPKTMPIDTHFCRINPGEFG